MSNFIRVGQIVGAFGLKGQVKVEPLTDFPQRLAKGSRLRLNGNWVEVEAAGVQKGRPLLKLSGIDTIDQAEALQWQYLESSEDRPPLEEDEYLTEDLLGLAVVTVDGRSLGQVTEVHRYPAQDILQVGPVMIPAVKQFVKKVDLQARQIIVDLIPGMLDE